MLLNLTPGNFSLELPSMEELLIFIVFKFKGNEFNFEGSALKSLKQTNPRGCILLLLGPVWLPIVCFHIYLERCHLHNLKNFICINLLRKGQLCLH